MGDDLFPKMSVICMFKYVYAPVSNVGTLQYVATGNLVTTSPCLFIKDFTNCWGTVCWGWATGGDGGFASFSMLGSPHIRTLII